MLQEGLGGKAVSPRNAFLLNGGFLHTNRHKLACCLNRILVIIIYPARVSRVWCCLRLAISVLSGRLHSSSAFDSLVQKVVPKRPQKQESQCPALISDSSMCQTKNLCRLSRLLPFYGRLRQREEKLYMALPGILQVDRWRWMKNPSEDWMLSAGVELNSTCPK